MIKTIFLLGICVSFALAQVISDEFIFSVHQQDKRQTTTAAPVATTNAPAASPLGPKLPDVAIPGLDFLGYGYDLRYERPVDGVRLPLITYNFDKGKTYTYPTYRDQRYLVPDEVFIRTVGRADAANYVAENSTEVQQALAVGVGVDYQRMTDARMREEKVTPNTTAPSSNYTSNYTMPPESGYFNDLGKGMPATKVNGTTKLFTLGVEFDFVQRNTKTGDNMVIRNDQIFQLWQMFVDQYKVRDTIQNDIDKLAGKTVESDPALFGSFFEKYGTHFVFSAVMGGAAHHTALINTVAEVDFTQVTLGLSVSYNTTTNTTSTSTQLETLIPNSANCTGTQAGYSWNTLKNICQAPISSTCWSPITEQVEALDYNSWNVSAPASYWKSGPNPWPLKAGYTQCDLCGYWYWCSWWFLCWRPYTCNCRLLMPVPPAWQGPTTNIGNYNLRSACPTCGKQLFVDGSSQQFVQQRTGIWRYMVGAINPGLIEFHMSGSFNGSIAGSPTSSVKWGGFVVFADAPQRDNHAADRQVLVFGSRLLAGSTPGASQWQLCVLVPGSGGAFAYSPNYCSTTTWPSSTWVKISAELNWDGQNMTIWYRNQQANGDYAPDKPTRLLFQIPFYNKQATSISKIETFVFDKGMQFYLDNINFCNAAGGAAFQPVTRDMAVQTSQSLLLQSISGKLDLAWSRTNSKTTFSQTSNYRLKGGDTSKINLLDISKTTDSFQIWKTTLPLNPAPVLYTLKEVSYLFPDLEVKGINQRAEMRRAIAMFLVEPEVGEIIFNTVADAKTPDFVNPA